MDAVRSTLSIRFCEQDRYDPLKDEEVTRLMCITNIGTWHTEVPRAKVKTHRAAFKTYVLEAMSLNQPPREVNFG